MKHYRSGTPRVACALAALTIMALTFGLFVVAPADVESSAPGSATIAANQALPPVMVVASLREHRTREPVSSPAGARLAGRARA